MLTFIASNENEFLKIMNTPNFDEDLKTYFLSTKCCSDPVNTNRMFNYVEVSLDNEFISWNDIKRGYRENLPKGKDYLVSELRLHIERNVNEVVTEWGDCIG